MEPDAETEHPHLSAASPGVSPFIRNNPLVSPYPQEWANQQCPPAVGSLMNQTTLSGAENQQDIGTSHPQVQFQQPPNDPSSNLSATQNTAYRSGYPLVPTSSSAGQTMGGAHIATPFGFDSINFQSASFGKDWMEAPNEVPSFCQSPGGLMGHGKEQEQWASGTPAAFQSPTGYLQESFRPPARPQTAVPIAPITANYGQSSQEAATFGRITPVRPTLRSPMSAQPLRSPRTKPRIQTILNVPQDGLIPKLKAHFYQQLPSQNGPVGYQLHAQLINILPHNALVGGLNELGRLTYNLPANAPLNMLCFAYLALAMAQAVEDYLEIRLPQQFIPQLNTEISSLLASQDTTVLSPAFLFIAQIFLDVFQVYLKEELRTACAYTCDCILEPHVSMSIINNIRQRFPSTGQFEADHGSIRNLELDLLRLRPKPLQELAQKVPVPAEMTSEEYFHEYIPFVRQQCGPYYCEHNSRASYHIWEVRLLWRALGAQADAPLREKAKQSRAESPSGRQSMAPLSEESSSIYLSPRSPVLTKDRTVDRATSPSVPTRPSTMPATATPSSSVPQREQQQQGFPCSHMGCHYVAIGSNAKKLLKRHRDALHNPNKERLPCPHCDKDFTRRDNLKAHIMKKHRGDPGPSNAGPSRANVDDGE